MSFGKSLGRKLRELWADVGSAPTARYDRDHGIQSRPEQGAAWAPQRTTNYYL
jgi:hypothetical protein